MSLKEISENVYAQRNIPQSLCSGIVPRSGLRNDALLGRIWCTKDSEIRPFQKLNDLIKKFASCHERCKNAKVDWHLMTVEPGAPCQEWHYDSYGHRGAYFTFIVPLTKDPMDSGTEFPVCVPGKRLKKTEIRNSFGSVIGFSGSQMHRGSAHKGNNKRLFLYAALYTGADMNV